MPTKSNAKTSPPKRSQTAVTPFGLTMASMPSSSAERSAVDWSAATVDPVTQLAKVDGRWAWEVSRMSGKSSVTEQDGKDPISVDTDPYYDYCGHRL